MDREKVETEDLDHSHLESTFETAFARAKESGVYGDYATAAGDYATAASVARAFGEEDARLVESLSRLAYCQYRLGLLNQAEEVYLEALSLMERFHKSTHPDRFASILWAIAVLLSDSRRFAEAETYFKRSMEVSESWAGPSDRFVADCLWGLSKCLTGAGKVDEAEDAIRRAIKIYETLPENVDEFLATNYGNLGSILFQKGKLQEACEALSLAVKLRGRLAGEYDPGLISLTNKLALALMQLGRHKEAEKQLRHGLKIVSTVYGEEHHEAVRRMVALGNCLTAQGKWEAAVKLLKRALKLMKSQENDPTLMSASLFELSTCYQKLKDEKSTKECLEELFALYESNPIALAKGAMYADSAIKLAAIYEQHCLFKKAKQHYEDALIAREKVYGQEHKLVADALMRLGACMTKMNMSNEGREMIRRAETMLADLRKRA